MSHVTPETVSRSTASAAGAQIQRASPLRVFGPRISSFILRSSRGRRRPRAVYRGADESMICADGPPTSPRVRQSHVPQSRAHGDFRWSGQAAFATHARAGRDDAAVGQVAGSDRRACNPCLRQGDGRHLLGCHPAHTSAHACGASNGQSAQDIGPVCSGVIDSASEASCHQCSPIVDLSRLWTNCDKSAPRPLRGAHRRRPCLDARDQGPAWRRDRGSEAKALRVGSGESRPVYDPELFRRARLGNMPLAEVMEAAGCCKASASDYRRGKRTPHVSTWANWLIRRVPRSPWSRTAGGPTIEGWRKRKR
jgi:hypothetical protein